MRFWVRLALTIAAVSITAVDIATRKAEVKSEEAVRREADNLAAYLDAWTLSRADTLEGWFDVWGAASLAEDDNRVALMRAVYKAMSEVVTVALVNRAGEAVQAPLYVTEA